MKRLTTCVGYQNGNPIYKTNIDMRRIGAVDKLKNALGKYEDAEENGQLLRIEVKIGDKASVIDKDYETDKMKVYDGIWERVCYVQSKDGSYSIHGEVSYDVYDFFYNDGRKMKHAMFVGQESTKVGDRVFIGENAHEQAEEKLKKLIS